MSERNHDTGYPWAGGLTLLVCLLLATPLLATEFTLESSFPRVFYGEPTDLALEGSVEVVATASGPVTPLENPAWLEPAGEQAWKTLFHWFESEPRQVQFVDAAQETLTVTFSPSPRMPLDFARHDLPVLCITTDPANLWDPELGIYAWGNYINYSQTGGDWERPAQLEYFTADGTLAFNEPIGLRINGGSSRDYTQKGLRLYFDDYGTSDVVEYDFFGEGPVRCERLVLRGSGYPDFAIGSGWGEPLHRDLGHPGSRWAYVAVYLNGEYWGAYALRERFDSKWVETTHEWGDDDYLLIKDNEAKEGDFQEWEDFLAGVADGDATSHAWFQWLDASFHLESYFDWILVNAMGQTADNMHGKNMAILRIGGDRLHFMAWDEDILFQSGNQNANYFSFYASADPAEFITTQPATWFSGGPWEFTFRWNALLRRGMQNAEFKARLRDRAAELLVGDLSEEAMVARLDTLSDIQAPEWVHHTVRWDPPWSYSGRLASARLKVTARHDIVGNQLAAFLDTWAEPAELIAFTATAAGDQAVLTWSTARELDCAGWQVERSLDTPDDFTVLAGYPDDPTLAAQGGPEQPAEYSFIDQALPAGREVYYRLTHFDQEGQPQVHSWVEKPGQRPEFDLRLNEFMADNDSVVPDEAGEYDDWLELYNGGTEPVSLGGLFLTDNLESSTKWALPDLVLGPGEFLVVWCDEDLDQGPLHASFKLGAGGEELGLFAGFAAGNLPIDVLVFGAQTTDVSWGRWPDGQGAWAAMDVATPGAGNAPISAAPLDTRATSVKLAPAWPNPTSGGLAVMGRVPAGQDAVRLKIFTVRGQLVRDLLVDSNGEGWHTWTWDGRDEAGRPASAGVYLLRLQAAGQVSHQRVVLVR
jgi:hypothetical protein|nr:CotH kinase family protein [Candidatus Krumholzibacteria bacterium]